MSLSIQAVAAADLPALRDLAEHTFRHAWQHDNAPEPFEAYCSENFALEKLAAEHAAPDAEFYFALLQEQPVAYLKLNRHRLPSPATAVQTAEPWPGDTLQLERIYVHPNAQGSGIGEHLLLFTENRARTIGATWVWLSVWQKAPRTIRFYEKNGFETFGVETFWVGDDPQPDWLMRKRITPPATAP
jgi:diamine N-acetyltransferase